MHRENVVVIGIGRVGLPLALVLAQKGFRVTGVDVNTKILKLVAKKKMPFLEKGAGSLLKKHYGKGFIAVHDENLSRTISTSGVIIITLGTPIDGDYTPDFSQITNFFKKATPSFKKNQLIILRSTISPGVTNYVKRYIESKTKFEVGKDIFLAYCPERIAEGKAIEESVEIPQIIGTFDKKSANLASAFFKKITGKVLLSDPLSAELAKLYCNIYRYIDFAIGNELSMIAEDQGADTYEVLRLVNDGYKRGGLKSPGLTAGPCLVKDSFFLLDKSPYLELMIAAWRINENVPGFLFGKIKDTRKSLVDKKVAILGLAFKRNIDDVRYSLTPKLQNHFTSEGAKVMIHDPFIKKTDSLEETLKGADVVVIAMNHDSFKRLRPKMVKKLVKKSCLVCDIWNIFGTGKIFFEVAELGKSGIGNG